MELVDDADGNVAREISKLLSADVEAKGLHYQPVPIVLRMAPDGQFAAGLSGYTLWQWLYIETLAVASSFQGQGLGKRLVLEAEAGAQSRHCRGAWVDTFTFQAPGFYQRLGYQPFGVLEQFPTPHQRQFLFKWLSPKEA